MLFMCLNRSCDRRRPLHKSDGWNAGHQYDGAEIVCLRSVQRFEFAPCERMDRNVNVICALDTGETRIETVREFFEFLGIGNDVERDGIRGMTVRDFRVYPR